MEKWLTIFTAFTSSELLYLKQTQMLKCNPQIPHSRQESCNSEGPHGKKKLLKPPAQGFHQPTTPKNLFTHKLAYKTPFMAVEKTPENQSWIKGHSGHLAVDFSLE